MAKIAVIGAGRVGLVTAACLADFGNEVTCADEDDGRIERLRLGKLPFFEPGIEDLIARNVAANRLSFAADAGPAIDRSEVVFIAVGTLPAADDSVDLRSVEAAARLIGRRMDGYRLIVEKSTVPVGTGRLLKAWVREELVRRNLACDFDVAANPEFLREGSAVHDFLHPDRVVLGLESERARDAMRSLWGPLYRGETAFVETGIESAEMIKYASNAFLALKISFVNEFAGLCEKTGADIGVVAAAMGMDGRIGPRFLEPGPGYGGSCLPKDAKAAAELARRNGSRLRTVEAAIEANEHQKRAMVDKIESALGTVEGKTVAILGLAFKPDTDDVREAPSMAIIEGLVERGGRIRAYDPEAMDEARRRLEGIADKVEYCPSEYDAARGADALVILTEWNQFRNLDLGKLRGLLRGPILCDLRNIYRRKTAEAQGFTYVGVGS